MTSQSLEKDILVKESGYVDNGVIMFSLPGSVGSGKRLIRMTLGSSNGPWMYQFNYDEKDGYKFDAAFGNLL